MRLKDKVAIVTGSGRGIGEGVARIFSDEGAQVIIACNVEAEGKRMAEILGENQGGALFVNTDVTSNLEVRNMVETTINAFGHIDILVNNAGYHISKNIEETSYI